MTAGWVVEVGMGTPRWAALFDGIANDRVVTAEEALAIRRTVFPDGVIDRAEAEALVAMAARVANDAPAFEAAFVDALGDHLLGVSGHVADADAEWLTARLAQAPTALALAAYMRVLQRAESAPERVAQAARALILAEASKAGMTRALTESVRSVLFATSGEAAAHVGDAEARWLFALEAAVAGFSNDPTWDDLFVKAQLNHVMAQRVSHLLSRGGMLDRQAWLTTETQSGPFAFFARAFSGGLEGFREAMRAPSDLAMLEAHYEARIAEGEEDAQLTLQEAAELLAMVRADGVETPNETRLLETLKRLEHSVG